MPLSETNKKQSQSIEDLIAQLDAPSSQTVEYGLTNGLSNSHIHNGETPNEVKNRKVLRGKRTNSTSLSSPGGNHDGTSSFQKANSFGQNSEPILCKNILMSKKYSKHMRLRDRGNPKKGGAGGKHTWGAPGCELDEEYLDTKDPNYDSENENVVMVCVENSENKPGKIGVKSNNSIEDEFEDDDDDNSNFENLKELTTENLDGEIKLIVLEYFHNGDTIEVIDHLKCYNLSKVRAPLIAYLIQIALEHNNTCKELMSRLLRDLTYELFAEKDFIKGFDLLMKNLSDLTLDNPDAPEKVGTFVARAIADKVLTKAYLDRSFTNSELPNLTLEQINKAFESARLLVNINDHLFQLSHIWGNKGGFLAVKELTDKINELILEYHDSGDVDEAIRCLKDLSVPHFHHEFIFEALDFALQKGSDHAIDLITTLLNNLCKSVIVTYDQLKIGFTRIFDLLPDISLDVPNANTLMDKILNQCQTKGFISDDIIDLAPNRSRKRFVSEGDGGRIKE